MLEAAPSVSAADLGVTRVKKVRVVHHKKVVRRSPLVRDYDGTAVVVRRSRVVVRNYDGTLLVTHRYEVAPVTGATPSRYMNGQPAPAELSPFVAQDVPFPVLIALGFSGLPELRLARPERPIHKF